MSGAVDLHGPGHLSLAFAVFDGVAFVVFGFAFGQSEFTFYFSGLPVQVQWHQRVAFLFHFADQSLDFSPVEQELSGANLIGADVRGGRIQWVNLQADDENFILAHHNVAVGQLHLAFTQRFDFPALQNHAGFQALFKKIVVSRLFIIGNAGSGFGFFGHKCDVGWQVVRSSLVYNPAQTPIL